MTGSVGNFAGVAGYAPETSVLLIAYTRDVTAGRTMMRLCAELARRADDALVDLGGLISPPYAPSDRARRLATSRAYVAGHPGLVLEKPYEVDPGLYWYTHVVSADFLDAWALDEHFLPVL